MFTRLIIGLITYLIIASPCFAQTLLDYKRFYSQNEFQASKVNDLVYAKAKTNYFKYKGSGSKADKSNYSLIKQIPLTLDLYQPNTSSKPGKRAVLILIPGGGRTGCLNVSQCDQKTVKQSGLFAKDAYYISQEGTNYNETSDTKARTYVKSGFLVMTLNTRYTYHDKRFEKGSKHRWKQNGTPILNSASAHLENLVVDVKRAIRWISHPSRANKYNIDPNNIFIQGGSGGAKMASLAAVTTTRSFLADSPQDAQSGNSQFQFEVDHNNLLVPQKALRGAILFAGDMNGTKHRSLISSDTGAIMFWHGTKDRSILHGITETMEQKCEEVGCLTEFYSLANVQHGAQGGAKYEHTDRASNSTGSKSGVHTHIHDFIVNHLDKGIDNRPQLSINSSKVMFNESKGHADIEINLNRAGNQAIKFTASADQMREVMTGNGTKGSYIHVESHVAKDGLTTGPIAYNQGTGVAFEDVKNVTRKYQGQTFHKSGPGNGFPVVIPASSKYFTSDFNSKKQVITIPAGKTKATFRITLFNDNVFEKNECFKVRLLNADGARISNSVETITIIDDDNPNAGTAIPEICRNQVSKVSGNNDNEKPSITIHSPTKNSQRSIIDTSVSITDDKGVFANDVLIDHESSTSTSRNFICNQLTSNSVKCAVDVLDSGHLVISATDKAGNRSIMQTENYTISLSLPDTKKPVISIIAPTKNSSTAITDTTVRIEDNVAVSADNVELRADNTANVSNLNCINITVKRVDCILRINSSGDLKLKVSDDARNQVNKNENGYVISTSSKRWVAIKASTKKSANVITDTVIRAFSDSSILASNVQLRADNTAGVSKFNCTQISEFNVNCTLNIISSGALKVIARDQSGKATQKIEHGYVIN